MVDAEAGLSDRVAALEKEVATLRRRIVTLEGIIAGMPEHGVDKTATRGKVVYDWQAPRP